jgi:hypothetical protein
MKLPARLLALLGLFTLACPALADTALPPELAGLVKVKAKRVDEAYLLPGTDFRTYTKVMIDPAEVAFRKDWMRNINSQNRSLNRKISTEDAQEIATAARSGFGEIWDEAFRKAGYEVVKSPGPDVLRLSPKVIDLYINAPDTMSPGRSRSYTVEAGEATLVLQASDSQSGAAVGYAVDRRRTRSNGMTLSWTTSVSNQGDFGMLFRDWANISVNALKDLKEKSPLPQPPPPKG